MLGLDGHGEPKPALGLAGDALQAKAFEALASGPVDAVSVNTYPDTHEVLVEEALNKGCHVFVEKPLALTVEASQRLVDLARNDLDTILLGRLPAAVRMLEAAIELRPQHAPLRNRLALAMAMAGRPES